MTACRRCGRALTREPYTTMGIGKICAAKEQKAKGQQIQITLMETKDIKPQNREIKFRAWSTEYNCFLKDFEYPIGHTGVWINALTGQTTKIEAGAGWDGDYEITYNNLENVVIQQYTTCKDHNEKEIYEGDLMQRNGGAPLIVKWGYTGWVFTTIDGELAESFSGFHDDYEVIGNVYDNPELLK